jgi:hypothetical protein
MVRDSLRLLPLIKELFILLKTMVAKDDLLILPVLLSSSPSMPIFGNHGILRILVVDKL